MNEDCIFCKIANGIIPTKFVYESANTVVFNDINPKAPMHMLVVPKKHYATLNDLDDKELMSELLQSVKEVTKKLNISDYKTLINTGKGAGQEVFHLHIHILADKKS